jgi:hypothetical protein
VIFLYKRFETPRAFCVQGAFSRVRSAVTANAGCPARKGAISSAICLSFVKTARFHESVCANFKNFGKITFTQT